MNDDSLKRKYKSLKRRIRGIEVKNDIIQNELALAKQHVKRLRTERKILLEELEEKLSANRYPDDDDLSCDSYDSESGSIASPSKLRRTKDILVNSNLERNFGENNSGASTPRKKKDPFAPKGPGNVFFLFCRLERDNIKDEMPNESLGDVTRALGQRWKSLSKSEKQKYYDLYKKEQIEYETAMKTYNEAGGGNAGATAVGNAADKKHALKQEEEMRTVIDEYGGEEIELGEDDEVDMLEEEEEYEEDQDENIVPLEAKKDKPDQPPMAFAEDVEKEPMPVESIQKVDSSPQITPQHDTPTAIDLPTQ